MASRWREIAIAQGEDVLNGTGSWKRRVAVALNKTEGSASWARRIVDGQSTGGSWERQALESLS